MAAAILKRPWLVANNGGWAETFVFWTEAVGAPDILAGYSATLSLLRPGRPASEVLVYNASDSPAYLALSGNQLIIDVPRDVTAAWAPGVYDVQIRIYGPAADIDRYNLVGPRRLTVIEAPGA